MMIQRKGLMTCIPTFAYTDDKDKEALFNFAHLKQTTQTL